VTPTTHTAKRDITPLMALRQLGPWDSGLELGKAGSQHIAHLQTRKLRKTNVLSCRSTNERQQATRKESRKSFKPHLSVNHNGKALKSAIQLDKYA